MKWEKSCGAVVYRNEGSSLLFLLVKMNVGHWSFPKGHVEKNESEIETALREIKEETHLDCEIMDGFREINTYSPSAGVMKEVVFFLAKAMSKEALRQVEEIEEIRWLNSEDAMKLVTYDTDRTILKNAILFIERMEE